MRIFFIAVFSIILSPVLASLSPVPSIEIDNVQGVLYEVNDDGETTIRVRGTMIGVSIATCNFQLEIPDSFEMDTLADGSPIMEMIANGTSVEKTQDDNEFGAVFVLKTYNSTLIPKSYLLEINTTNLQYSGFITPQWPQQELNNPEGGGGAGITSLDPYITDFKAFNSEKGQKEHVKTWIYNPSAGVQYLERLRYKIKADDYGWEDWTPWYYENAYIWDGYTLVVHDYLDYIFTSPFSPYKSYALNIGDLEPGTISKDYKVTSVRAEGTGFASTYSPGWKGKFNVNPPASGTHVVFVAHLVDQAFKNRYDENDWFDDLETQSFDVDLGVYYLSHSRYKLDFESQVFDWEPSTTDIDGLFFDLSYDAESILGLSTVWVDIAGTHYNNNGFDLLFGSAYQTDTSGGGKYGKSSNPGNKGLAMKGGNHKITSMHEVLHTFHCSDNPVFGGWIMAIWPFGWQDWEMHLYNDSILRGNLDQYDGLEE